MRDSHREKYTRPHLTVFGRIEDLTRTGCFANKQVSTTSDDSFASHVTQFFFGISLDDCSVS